MKIPHSEPEVSGSARARMAKHIRTLALEISRLHPQAMTKANGEENDHGFAGEGQKATYPANFTKGLLHDKNGLLKEAADYRCFVTAINSHDTSLFEKDVVTAYAHEGDGLFNCHIDGEHNSSEEVKWRGWESPRSGHVYELEGPDAGAVGMAPAPRTGSSELAAEMAEVYGLALLRDVPFTEICTGGGKRLCASDPKAKEAVMSAKQVVDCLNKMPFFKGHHITSSTPCNTDKTGLNKFERNRRFARTQSLDAPLTPQTAFRGSTPGALVGPYISQFMLIGTDSIAGSGDGISNFPGEDSQFDLQDGFIPYGSLIIDQRTITHKNCLDFMTDWSTWLDVQNGANFKSGNKWEQQRRFITTPRDLATYVHFDALYEAYLNAGLILLGMGARHSKGFPEPSPTGHRDAFATFGGPHILSLVTEVATRCLKAVRRQKFNYHRRARPEALGGRLSLVAVGNGSSLGCAEDAYQHTFAEIHESIRNGVIKHNGHQNTDPMITMRGVICDEPCLPEDTDEDGFNDGNLLLPMAFPEGSPMHPAYGAGHATVAGGCVTMLKAFFEMFEDCDSGVERPLRDKDDNPIVYVPNDNGSALVMDDKFEGCLTIQGELDKLAANISIGRNMAGVHYYSDYYDSLRMGERIAVGILMEQCQTYGETVESTFKSFDGDMVTITAEAGAAPSLYVMDRDGARVSTEDWWLRHTVGQAFNEDM